jgi:sigma-B regulation protein RsbU (phosphoserine phosphatase)
MGVATTRTAEHTLSVPSSEPPTRVRLRLAVRGFLALALLLAVTIVATSATLLYNAATTLRAEAEANAVNLSEVFSASFAEMGEISAANVARTLDATLDPQMIAQARIAAHLTAAAEAAGWNAPRIIRVLEGIVGETVLDEFWITDETAYSYLTNVRDERGRLVPFAFDPDPAVQPQASKFYVLLDGVGDDDVITQPAQVREIDNQVYKYVGVGGVDKQRIVQVGNGIVFSDQEIMTSRYTSERADVSAIIEGILGQQMAAQGTMLERFIAAAEAAEWTRDDIEFRLRNIATQTVIGEIRVADANNVPLYSSLLPPAAGGAGAALVRPGDLDEFSEGSLGVVEHPTAARPADGALYKYVTVATGEAARRVQVGVPIQSASGGNLLYSVYQREADVQVRSGNQDLDALWVVNLDRELAAAARRAEVQTSEGVDAWQLFEDRAATVMNRAMDRGTVESEVSLSLFSPEDRGIWVASPLINAGGIPIGGLAIAMSLDEIADTVIGETRNTVFIALVLLTLTGFAAAGGTRWLTHPIEVIADAARQVESGKPPDNEAMQDVIRRTDELGSLARVFSDMTVQVFNREEQLETMVAARTRELRTSNQRLQIAHEAIKQDLSMAKVVQEALVREGDAEFGAFSVSARMTPAQQIGGDFVEFTDASGGQLSFVLGDVSGKGVAAALFMAASQSAVMGAFAEHTGISTIANEANRRLCQQNPMGLFVTCVLGVLDVESGRFDYVCAGHEPAYVVGPDDGRRPLPMTQGLAMGLMDDFEYASGSEVIQPGETLFIYTDGLTDAVNLTGELFGKERLEATLDGASARSPEEIVDHVWSEIGTYSAGAPAADDMTCLVLRRRR